MVGVCVHVSVWVVHEVEVVHVRAGNSPYIVIISIKSMDREQYDMRRGEWMVFIDWSNALMFERIIHEVELTACMLETRSPSREQLISECEYRPIKTHLDV